MPGLLAFAFEPFHFNLWKAIGLTGALLFGFRWVVQAVASRRAGRPVVPLSFWLMSATGSLLTLAYFIFYRGDSVGVLNTAPPFLLSLYNLWLLMRPARPALPPRPPGAV